MTIEKCNRVYCDAKGCDAQKLYDSYDFPPDWVSVDISDYGGAFRKETHFCPDCARRLAGMLMGTTQGFGI